MVILDAITESEDKVILVSENDLFLTLGSATFSARNENLRPLLNLVGSMASENTFLTTGKSFSHEEKIKIARLVG